VQPLTLHQLMVGALGFPKRHFMAFLSGATVGAVAALLVAPQSGRESREQLRGYVNRAGYELWQLLNEDAIGSSCPQQ
jgi:gas vesicle protein